MINSLTIRAFSDSWIVEDKARDMILGGFDTFHDAETACVAIESYVQHRIWAANTPDNY